MLKKNTGILTTGISALFFLFASLGFCADKQAADKPEIEDIGVTIKESFKKAVEELDTQKAIERQQEQERVTSLLNTSINDWISGKELERRAGLKGLVGQQWQNLLSTPPEHQDYYLRDFYYHIDNADMAGQDSVPYPYKAAVWIKEILYVEKAPLIAQPRSDYEYTADTRMLLRFQYEKDSDSWQLIDSEVTNIALNKGWPNAIVKKVGTFFIPKE